MNNHTVPVPSPAALPSVGRREPERSEGDRSATDGKAGANLKTRPDPEVVAQAKRRRFTGEYKQRILTEADLAKGSGGIGRLLRREGLYSSLLATWRREREAGGPSKPSLRLSDLCCSLMNKGSRKFGKY